MHREGGGWEDEEFGQREGVGRCTEREGKGRMRSLGRGRGWGGAQRGKANYILNFGTTFGEGGQLK